MQEMTIKDILSILRNRILYLIVIPLLVLVVAVVYLSYKPDVYSAETKLYVLMDYRDSSGQTRYDANVSIQLAGDFKELIKTPQVITAAEAAMGNTISLRKDVVISVSAVAGTRILNVTATSKYPSFSALAANTISQVFVDYIADLTNTNTVTIASEAVVPKVPSGPPRRKIAIAVYLLTLIALAALFIVIEILNTTLRTTEDIEAKLGVPVLANIEDYRKSLKDFFKNKKKSRVISEYVSPITRESVKTLATNVEFSFAGREMDTLMVTSTLSTEGKSSLTILLAEALADDGYRVLIVDTDFRKPSIGKYLGVRNQYDLTDYIRGDVGLNDIIVETHHKRVNFIDSRHKLASTSQIFNFDRFHQLLNEAKQVYDIILFDTPPLGLFIDAAVLAGVTSGTLMVVGKGLAEGERAKEVVGQLHKVGANLIGVALNYTTRHKGSKYYYGKYYGRYGRD